MIRYCLDKWKKNKKALMEDLKNDKTLNECDYYYLVQKVVAIILNGSGYEELDMKWDTGNITEVDNGHYQGTLLYLIPSTIYHPSEDEYLMTYINYGSCSACDTLKSIQVWEDCKITDGQVNDFMRLCKDIVCNMIRPYNVGWRAKEIFAPVE